MKKRILVVLFALALSANLRAQVTIGELVEPTAGALLDLNKAVKGGLALSNVTLEDLYTIPVGFPGISAPGDVTTSVKDNFRGAIVYHTGGYGIPIGVYVWNGTNWTFFDENCTPLDASRLRLTAPLLDVKQGATETFSVASDASARCAGDETYTWSVPSKTLGTDYEISTTSGTTTNITFKTIGTYTVTVTVTSPFASAPIQKTASVNVTATGGISPSKLNSNYGIVGAACLDVKKSKQPASQSDAAFAARIDAFAGGSYEKTYKFIHSAAYSDLSLDYIDPSNLVKEITVYPPASAAASGTAVDNYYEKEFKIQFSSNIQDLVPDNGDSLSVQLIASYKPDGSTETKLAYLEIRVEDGTCVCPAKISATQWLNFACHNLGALDILSSSQLITRAHHGHWYRFGARAASMVNTPEHDTNNTWDDSYYLNNGERWNTQPCPAGWRLPTISELAAAVNKTESGGSLGTDNNTLARSGTWINSTTNFSVLLKVGDYLYLPVAGLRQSTNGDLDHRGNNGFYWSSSHGTTSCKSMDFDSENQFVNSRGRASGLSVRCVAAE